MVITPSSGSARRAQKSKNVLLKKPCCKKAPEKKSTHLYLHDKFLATIENSSLYENLQVLYLYNNDIRKIENLNAAPNLKSLYLQKNKISKMENLDSLKSLRKLYLGHNEISVVEGLENLSNLEELHIEKQRLHVDCLCFDPRTVIGISQSLQVLNISYNNMNNIACLGSLKCIKIINVCHNKLDDMRDVCDTVLNWHYLFEATFTGNPIVKTHRYRENLIANTYRLTVLDGKEVNETTRCFLKRFEQEKLNQSSKPSINLAEDMPSLPHNYPASIQKAVSHSILKTSNPNFDDSTFRCNVDDIYLPWKALVRSSSTPGKNLPASFKKQQKRNPNRQSFASTFPNIS